MGKDGKWQIFKQIESDIHRESDRFFLRGAVTRKNEKTWDNVPLGGGGQKCPNFNLGILKTEDGLYFSKMSELKRNIRHHQK